MNQNIESGVQLFSRAYQRNDLEGINPKIFGNFGPQRNQTVEIVGDNSQELLVDFLARCILPSGINPEWKGLCAIFMNCDHHISITKIRDVINEHLKQSKVTSPRKSLVEESLGRLTILNCYDNEQVEVTIRNLEKIVQNEFDVSLVVVDNLTSNYWTAKQSSMDYYAREKFILLQKFLKDLNLLVVFARQQLADFKKPLHHDVDYKIVLNSDGEFNRSKAVVINYERESESCFSFGIKTILSFD